MPGGRERASNEFLDTLKFTLKLLIYSGKMSLGISARNSSGYPQPAPSTQRYSYRRASTGLHARGLQRRPHAGVTPTNARITNAVSITLLEVFRTMSPS